MVERMRAEPDTLPEAVSVHWKALLPTWLCLLYLLYVVEPIGRVATTSIGSIVLMVLPFFAAWTPLSVLWMSERIRFRHLFALGIVLPFLIFVFAILLRFVVSGGTE